MLAWHCNKNVMLYSHDNPDVFYDYLYTFLNFNPLGTKKGVKMTSVDFSFIDILKLVSSNHI